jgi:hypothetical protein
MASLRKRQSDADAPVSTPPRAVEPASTEPPAPLPEAIKTTSPADEAGKTAIQQRLAEMETAQRQQPQQHVATEPVAIEPEPQQADVPPHIQKWLAANPKYTNASDPVAQAEIHLATMKCVRDGLAWDQEAFIPALERHLSFKPQQSNGSDAGRQAPVPQPRPAVRQQAPTVAYSAPPSREVPSYATGKPRNAREPLTPDELNIARQCGQTPEQYQQAKEMLQREGRIGPGARDGR